MSKWLKVLAGGAFALFVAAALTLGAQTAFARSVTSDCPYPGSCIDHNDCTVTCQAIYGPEAAGHCTGNPGCCVCTY